MKNSCSPKVLVVVVNYNGVQLLRKHLDSIIRTAYDNFELVVVDNGSDDESVKFLQQKYPDISVLASGGNIGFGRAFNLVYKQYKGYDYYALLNNDIEVHAEWLTGLVATAQSDEKIGAVGPAIVYSKEREGRRVMNSAGLDLDLYGNAYDRYEGQEYTDKLRIVEDVDALCGGAVLLRGEALREVNGFDERMFMYYEDIDICLRIRDKGWRVVYNGRVAVLHDHMATSGSWSSARRNWHVNKNRMFSIAARRGWALALSNAVQVMVEWIVWKIGASRSGKTFREYLSAKGGGKAKY